MNPPSKKRSSKTIMEPFKHLYSHRELRTRRKHRDLGGFFGKFLFSPGDFFTSSLPQPPGACCTYGSFDLGIKVPSSFIRSLMLNLLLRSTLGETARMLQVIFIPSYNLLSASSEISLSTIRNVCLKLKIQ